MGQYLPVAAMIALAIVFAGLSIVVSKLLAPRRATSAKRAPYECGIVPGRSLPERFPVHFYLVAMIFIVFDIEIIFLFPWATLYRDIGAFGLVAVGLFTVPVVIGLLYEISTGTFGWGEQRGRKITAQVVPAAPDVDVDAMISEERTASTTVRRVGLEGREHHPGHPEKEVVSY
jgi:NADH-quinone oxidoreductase subunit A